MTARRTRTLSTSERNTPHVKRSTAHTKAIGNSPGSRSERRFLNDIRHVARRAADFHRRMDRYRQSPWDDPREIDLLTDDARRIRNAHVVEHTWDDWAAVIDVLAQMQRSAVAEHGRDRYGDHDGNRDGIRYSDRGRRRY
jgi:hypothetical protein